MASTEEIGTEMLEATGSTLTLRGARDAVMAAGSGGLAADVGSAPTHDRPRRITAALFLAFATALALSSWSSIPVAAERGPVKSLLEMRRENVVVQDFDLSCGAAALATLLNYQHGDSVSEREVTEALIRREEYLARPELVRVRQGFSLLDLKRYVDQRGYEGIGYGQLEFEDLVGLAPAMVPVNFNGYKHFVIFRGKVGDRVVLADPAWGNRTMSVERFEASWMEYPEFGKVGFTVARRDGTELPNQLAPGEDDLLMTPQGSVLRQVLSSVQP